MILKTVVKRSLQNSSTIREDLEYWRSKSPEECLAVVEYLRRQYHGNAARLQRVARIVQRPQG